MTTQVQANAKLWEQVTVALETKATNPPAASGVAATTVGWAMQCMVCIQKMMPVNNPEAFLNAFERMTPAVGWPQNH